jgi:hypothetical protein
MALALCVHRRDHTHPKLCAMYCKQLTCAASPPSASASENADTRLRRVYLEHGCGVNRRTRLEFTLVAGLRFGSFFRLALEMVVVEDRVENEVVAADGLAAIYGVVSEEENVAFTEMSVDDDCVLRN